MLLFIVTPIASPQVCYLNFQNIYIYIFRIKMICLKIQTGERKIKGDRGVELGSNQKHFSLVARAGLEQATCECQVQ